MNPYILVPLFDNAADYELAAKRDNTPPWKINGDSFERLVWARAMNSVLRQAEKLLKDEVKRARNNLISEIEKWVVLPDTLPPGDKRIHQAEGAVIALNKVLEEWDSHND